jgi:signal transduction histidine kinase/DNA-binding response OmpR family regulator/HPt (histidine-containing phosphotransfer) domain-containing protein
MRTSTVEWNANPRALAIQFAVVACICALAIGIIAYLYNRERDSLLQEGLGAAQGHVARINQQIERRFDSLLIAGTMLRDVARQLHDKDDLTALFIPVASALLERTPMVSRIYIGYPDGSYHGAEATAGTVSIAAAGQEDFRQQAWFRQATERRDPIWIPPHVIRSDAEPQITYAVPLLDQTGQVKAVVGLDIGLGTVSHLLQPEIERFRGKVFIADRNGEVLWHPALEARLKPGTAPLQVDDLGDDDALAMYAELGDAMPARGIARQRGGLLIAATSGAISQAWPFSAYVGLPETVVVAPANTHLQNNLVIAFMVTLALIVGVIYTARLRSEVAARRETEAELRVARDLAEAATEAKSTFLATMSHEIRTPMNGVMSMAEMLELTPLDADQHRMAKVIRDSTEALLTVINDILDFSKIEAGKLDIERVPFNLTDLVGGVGELLAPKADNSGLEFILDIDPSIPEQRIGDPTRIRQILLNLGSNAVKFTEKGQVTIRVRSIDNGLRFEVEDTGIGLTPEQLDKLFQPFVQADSSTARKFGGTGLGLSICRRLCEMMDGRIDASSVPGKSTVFWFELPLPPAEENPQAPQPADPISRARVLLLGLPAAQAEVARRYFFAGGVEDVTVAASHAAAEALKSRDFDLVLVDPRCPDLPSLRLSQQFGENACYAVIAPRNLISTLDAAQRAHFRIALTYPILRPVLWRSAAVSLGLLPATQFQIQNVEREDMAFAPPPLEEARAAGAAILVAEDNLTNQTVIAQMLSRLGYACEIAENGTAALALYKAAQESGQQYGLLLTDFHMPEMDGFELTHRIRELEAASGTGARIPIIALTADALTGIRQRCLDAGMDEYLTKPINSRHLGETLAHFLPQALPLRRPANSNRGAVQPAAPGPAPSWDTDIFDPQVLRDSFGSFDQKVKELLQDFIADTAEKIKAIEQAAGIPDIAGTRRTAHALKGAARSIGANRLGQVAADLQDACDAQDADMVKIMARLLAPTYEELRGLMPAILAS